MPKFNLIVNGKTKKIDVDSDTPLLWVLRDHLDPLGALNQVEGGVIDGIGHAMFGNLKFKNGQPQSTNFHNYRLIRMMETPQVEAYFIESDIAPTGLGEPTLPPASAELANAIKAATGIRITKQPFIENNEVFGDKQV